MKKILFPLTLVLLLFGCTIGQDNATNEKTNLSATEFLNKIKELGSPQLVDVRTPNEFKGGHIENAVNIDWNGSNFNDGIAKLDKTKPVMVYCLSGGRSKAAAKEMRKQGFENVIEMTGGMMEWRSKKLPEVSGEQTAKSAGISLDEYKKLINSDKLVFVDFYAEWCGPCKRMEPYINKFTESEKEKLVVIRIDADANQELCQQLNVTALPTMKLYKNNKMVWDNIGFVSEEELLGIIQGNY
ncbi:MAG: thioredoxin domain-containing protein [Crocinitomicaceae bacterium]|nr:thioredoxin domain-containing protein [Crocinitomicaceae bacterium]